MPAGGPHIEVTGRAELVRTMKAAGADLKDLNAANKEAAAVVAPESRARTPRRSGRLAGTVRPAGTRAAAIVRIGSRTVPYAGPIIFGWPGHHITAQPGPVEALTTTEPRWLPVYLNAIDAILNKIKGV
jgi:hypothetical protein